MRAIGARVTQDERRGDGAPRAFWVAFAVTILGVSWQYAIWHTSLTTVFSGATPLELARGTGMNPFQQRTLVPLLLRLALRRAGADGLQTVVLVVDAGAFAAFLTVVFAWLRRRGWPHVGALVLALLGGGIPLGAYVLPRMNAYFMVYDTPALALFTAGLALISLRAWWPYYVLFPIATLNRETTFLLTGAMALGLWGCVRVRTIALHVIAQAALWGAVKGAAWWAFRHNVGAGVAEVRHAGTTLSHLSSNLDVLSRAGFSVPAVLTIAGALWIPALAFGRAIPDPTLRRAWWLLPAWFGVMMVIGNIYELRVFGEFAGLAVLSAAVIIRPEGSTAAPRAT